MTAPAPPGHRVEAWWTTWTWTAVCLDCPWQAEGSYAEVSSAAAAHSSLQRIEGSRRWA